MNTPQMEVDHQVQSFLKVLAGYEPTTLYNHCFELLRGLSEQWVFADELGVAKGVVPCKTLKSGA